MKIFLKMLEDSEIVLMLGLNLLLKRRMEDLEISLISVEIPKIHNNHL